MKEGTILDKLKKLERINGFKLEYFLVGKKEITIGVTGLSSIKEADKINYAILEFFQAKSEDVSLYFFMKDQIAEFKIARK